MKHLEHHNIVSDQQHGFQVLFDAVALWPSMNDLAESTDELSQIDAVLDFSKAFSKVSDSRLLLKLEHYSIRTSIFSWMTDLNEWIFINADTIQQKQVCRPDRKAQKSTTAQKDR